MKNPDRSATSWGRYAVYQMIRTFNCPGAMHQTCQQMLGVVGNTLLAATSGLAAGNHLANDFEARYGSIECQEITGTTFTDWTAFQTHLCSSDRCRSAMDFVATEAVRIIS